MGGAGLGVGRSARAAVAMLAAGLVCAFAPARAAEPGAAASGADPGPHRVSCELRWVSFATLRSPGNSPLAQFESLAGSTREARTEARPAIALDAGPLHFGAQPRLALVYRHFRERLEDERDESDVDLFLNAGEIAWSPHERLRLSVERVALDWGPATLLSPSNPLGRRNARLNPLEELPGGDFAAARWFPDEVWTVTVLANVDEGRADPSGFRRSAILKIDRSRDESFASLVLSRTEGADPRAGGFLAWSLSEALRTYAEAGFAARDAEAVAGFAWTFPGGATLAVEYLYNESGSRSGAAAAVAARPGAVDARDLFLRENYVMLQWSDADVRAARDAVVRVVHCLDDGSSALVGYAQAGFGEHVRLHVFGVRAFGGPGDELAAVLRSTVSVGAEYAF